MPFFVLTQGMPPVRTVRSDRGHLFIRRSPQQRQASGQPVYQFLLPTQTQAQVPVLLLPGPGGFLQIGGIAPAALGHVGKIGAKNAGKPGLPQPFPQGPQAIGVAFQHRDRAGADPGVEAVVGIPGIRTHQRGMPRPQRHAQNGRGIGLNARRLVPIQHQDALDLTLFQMRPPLFSARGTFPRTAALPPA